LGLAISRQLVELMQGQIGLESEPGRGSTFHFTVRLEKQTCPAATVPRRTFDPARLRVLIVDDNATNREILDEQLQAWRISNRCAAGGEEALRQLRQAADSGASFSLAILDLDMPDIDGVALARRIKSDPAIDPLLARLGTLAKEGRQMFERAELEKLGRHFDAAHEALRELGVSCAELEEAVGGLRRAGALGAKLTGAGGGGAAIGLARNAAHAAEIAARTGGFAVKVPA